MVDQGDHANRNAVGHYWATPEFKALLRLLATLPPDEQNIEGLFNTLSSRRLYGGRVGIYNPDKLLALLTSYIAELIGARVGDADDVEVYGKFRDLYLTDGDVGIITFNYDFLGEQLLASAHGGFHYGFPFDRDKYRYHRLRGARGGPPLFKLHGSLSWVICSVCRTVWMHEGAADHWQGKDCPRNDCHGHLRLLIVPPLWDKGVATREMGILWEAASYLLQEADEVVVIGFSFAPADHLAMDLIRDTLRRNRRAKVSICNGPSYPYDVLSGRMGREFAKTGQRLEDLC